MHSNELKSRRASNFKYKHTVTEQSKKSNELTETSNQVKDLTNESQIRNDEINKGDRINFKRILLHSRPNAWDKISFDGCEESRCELIRDLNAFNTSDCVIFHIARGMDNVFPPPKPPGQVWIFFAREAPYRTLNFETWLKLVNWTYTIRRDSDILMPYGNIFQRNKPISLNFSGYISRKTKTALAIISNCHAQSLRFDYIKLLKKYIDIDVYGACGEKGYIPKKSKFSTWNNTYKFHLSFENSMCRNYITEKAFDVYSFAIVPVVRGWAHYQYFLPPGSYIDTKDFPKIRDLGKYLKYLDSNQTAYEEYFKPRDYFGSTLFLKNMQTDNEVLCTICKRLHNPEKYIRLYDDFQVWWNRIHPKQITPDKYDEALKNYDVHCTPPDDLQ